jgi:hypothetical protein
VSEKPADGLGSRVHLSSNPVNRHQAKQRIRFHETNRTTHHPLHATGRNKRAGGVLRSGKVVGDSCQLELVRGIVARRLIGNHHCIRVHGLEMVQEWERDIEVVLGPFIKQQTNARSELLERLHERSTEEKLIRETNVV